MRGFSREQIAEHLREVLAIYDELAEERADGIPPEIAPSLFAVVQQMSSAIEPAEAAAARKGITVPGGANGEASRLGIIGGG